MAFKRYSSIFWATLWLAMFAVIGLGCSVKVVPKKSSKGQTPQFQPVNTAASSKVDFRLRGLAPHQYQAEVQWPEGTRKVQLVLNKQTLFDHPAPTENQFTIALVPKSDYDLRLYGILPHREDPEELLGQWSFQAPVDMVLDSQEWQKLPAVKGVKEIRVQRLFLQAGSAAHPTLITQGLNVQMIADELISDSSVIETFPSAQKASMNQSGRSGGRVFIRARTVKGELTIIMRGEQGGDGSPGPAHTERAGRGYPGAPAENNCLPHRGNGSTVPSCQCKKKAGHGEAGHPGAPGLPGMPGRQGGASGRFLLEVLETPAASEWKLSVKKEAGKAGTPGPGGPGQIGGVGGDPGVLDSWGKCRLFHSPKRGPDGPNGPAGPQGSRESDGAEEQECLSYGHHYGMCLY